MRILPRTHEDVNEEWISDKARFVWDGLRAQRLDRPYLREIGKLRAATWPEAFTRIAQKVKGTNPERIGIILGDLVGAEEAFALKQLATALGIANIDCRQDGTPLGEKGGRAGYLFNTTIAGIEQADAIVLIGANPRVEASVLNARIRKRWIRGNVFIGVIGEKADLNYGYTYLGTGPDSLARLAKDERGKGPKIVFILGPGALARPDGAAVFAEALEAAKALGAVKDGWNGFNVLHTAAGRVGALDVGALPGAGGKSTRDILSAAQSGELDTLFLLGADEIELPAPGSCFVVYQGSHGDRSAHRADVILPGAAYTEKSITYVNTEGRPQMTRRATFPPGEAREDWAILRALSEALGATLPWNSLSELRRAMYAKAPHLARLDQVAKAEVSGLEALSSARATMAPEAFASPIKDFYLTNPIARASRIMAECSALRNKVQLEAAE
jgi:NADH-quinone oxidoreductase subunit G